MTPFILLAHPRSGSELLADALGQHPEVRCFGELFHPRADVRARYHCLDDGRAFEDGTDPLAFVRTVFASTRAATGFKVFYDHPEAAWRALVSQRGLHVIHLRRKNLLASLVSLHVALNTNEWQLAADEEPRPVPAFPLSTARCQSYFETTCEQRARALDRLTGCPRLDLEYSALDIRFQETLTQAFEHLGLCPVPVEKRLARQATRPLREQLSNFAELRRHFSGSPWGGYFAD